MDKPFQINVRENLKSKNPRLYKFMPGFVLRIFERIVHQKDVNEFLAKHSDKKGVDFAAISVKEFGMTVKTFGEEKIPRDGRLIFVANHPMGAMESLAWMTIIHKYHPNLKFPVNDILLSLGTMNDLFVPINKHGNQAKESARLMEEAYASDSQLLFYPAGLVSRKIKGKITDLEWRKNFVSKAVKHQRDVVPVFIDAKNTDFFYNIARIRKILGIKANIEMLLLPSELYKGRNKTITFTFGEKIPYSQFDKSKTPAEWAEWVKNKVYNLRDLK
ncbi:MAG: 1-acyl-sn-glycerol-3-phosphate acyltransferase [Bacteroidales bacterium]|nr:1-acyl-sn-glycerol-3-phosphate acyltransferase [Bacteroidales bacterium]